MKTLAIVLIFITSVTALPLSRSKTMVITPNNLRAVAKYLDNNVYVDANVIRVTSGSAHETLIQVPLASAEEIDPRVTIRLTVGFDDQSSISYSSNIRVGISDGSSYNQFRVYGRSTSSVCAPYSASSTESNTANEGRSYHPGEVSMLFQPFYKYGSCATGHDGGHVNVGTFASTVDLSKGLLLQVNRYLSNEQYRIYYFIVEIL